VGEIVSAQQGVADRPQNLVQGTKRSQSSCFTLPGSWLRLTAQARWAAFACKVVASQIPAPGSAL